MPAHGVGSDAAVAASGAGPDATAAGDDDASTAPFVTFDVEVIQPVAIPLTGVFYGATVLGVATATLAWSARDDASAAVTTTLGGERLTLALRSPAHSGAPAGTIELTAYVLPAAAVAVVVPHETTVAADEPPPAPATPSSGGGVDVVDRVLPSRADVFH